MRKSCRGPLLALLVLASGASALAQPAESPKPRSQAALRHLIEGVSAGRPDYAAMSPKAAATTRAQLNELRAPFRDLGALQAVTFVKVDDRGRDAYSVTFVNGMADLTIALTPTGKVDAWDISGAATRPAGEHH